MALGTKQFLYYVTSLKPIVPKQGKTSQNEITGSHYVF